jgi:hypothetical protein
MITPVTISALFVRKDSVYKTLGIDCWDIERDAVNWPGGNPIIAHPPCRAWGKLSHFARPRPGEKDLAIKSIELIREWGGGVGTSSGFKVMEINLPYPGCYDEYGGFSICIDQFWFGHKAQKKTLLYICGCSQSDLPPIPMSFDAITHVIGYNKKNKFGRVDKTKKEVTRAEREHTPIELAKWLIKVAGKCKPSIEIILNENMHQL